MGFVEMAGVAAPWKAVTGIGIIEAECPARNRSLTAYPYSITLYSFSYYITLLYMK
jgi:hypothetical protein